MSPSLRNAGRVAGLLALALTGSTAPAMATAKFLHVPDVLATEAIPNPPASEDEAAGWQGSNAGLPRVVRLQQPKRGVAAAPPALALLPAPTRLTASCPPAAIPAEAVGSETLYGAADLTYAGKIYFQRPAWDSTRFLAAAGWSEQRDLWMSKVGR